MSFLDIVSAVGKAAKKELMKKNDEYKKDIARELRKKSDQEIEHAYRNRHNNSNLKTEWQLSLIEEEAHRRNIY